MMAKARAQVEPVRRDWEAAIDRWHDRQEAEVEACDQLMSTPAPDLQALWWKIQRLLAVGPGGTTAIWMAADVQPVLDDCKRLLA